MIATLAHHPNLHFSNIDSALSAWADLLGEDAVLAGNTARDPYHANTLGVKRTISGVLKPSCVTQITGILKVANTFNVPIYPISTGRNWGYGSANPVSDNNVILDLSGLNQILHFDRTLGLITIQPGVTQGQLYQFLSDQDAPYLAPVTGAGPSCSPLANALERGFGLPPCSDHFAAVTDLTAILPNGETYQSALAARGATTIAASYKWGIGPYLDGLFTQSNLGVVTSITLKLAPKREATECFVIQFNNPEDLSTAATCVRELNRRYSGLLSALNLSNRRRVLSMLEPFPQDSVARGALIPEALVDAMAEKHRVKHWSLFGAIYGTPAVARAVKREMSAYTQQLGADVFFFNKKKVNRLKHCASWIPGTLGTTLRNKLTTLSNAMAFVEGQPSDMALPLVQWKARKPTTTHVHQGSVNPDQTNAGLYWYSPLVPNEPEAVHRFYQLLHDTCEEYGFEPLLTLTNINDICFDATLPILFDRSQPEEVIKAKQFYEVLLVRGEQAGFLPYRLNIEHMPLFTEQQHPYWQLVSQIKAAVDPNGILAPGRYAPL